MDNLYLSTPEEDDIQFANIKVIPTRNEVKQFSFRISATAMRELQPGLSNPIRVPDHLVLVPTLIDKFVIAFREFVIRNPEYVIPDTEVSNIKKILCLFSTCTCVNVKRFINFCSLLFLFNGVCVYKTRTPFTK